MSWALINHALSDDFLNDFFERNAFMQYSRKLLFSSIFSVMSLCATGAKSSVGKALESKIVPVGVSDQAFYNKLNGIEPALCEALVQETSRRLDSVSTMLGSEKAPPVSGYRTLILDGNAIGATEHRIEELREISSAPLPGKSLVIFDAQKSTAVDMIACEDGWAQERSMSDKLLGRVCVGDLYIADRNFCTVKLLHGIHNNGGAFAIREHKALPWKPMNDLIEKGSDERGTVYEQDISIEAEDGTVLIARRIVLKLPNNSTTRDGDRKIAVITTLPKNIADSWKIAELYRARWSVETMFQTLTTTFRCEAKALGYPRAALFNFAIALVAYNVLSVLRTVIRSVRGVEAEAMLSIYYLVDAIQFGSATFIDGFGAEIVEEYRNMNVAELLTLPRTCAENLDLTRYRKKPTRPGRKKTAKRPAASQDQPHISTARILANSKKRKTLIKYHFFMLNITLSALSDKPRCHAAHGVKSFTSRPKR